MKKLLNKRRKAGILQKEPPVGIICMGLALAGVLFALAFYLEGFDDP